MGRPGGSRARLRRGIGPAPACAAACWVAAAPWAAAESGDAGKRQATVSEQITIRGKGAAGPALSPPPAAPEKPVLDEVERSLRLYREDLAPPQAPKVSGASRRIERPFPESPYLVFSPRSFSHPHDRWSFEVLGNGRRLYFIEGRGALEESIRWDGSDDSGRMAARVGESYSFRFTGYHGEEEASVASEPLELVSLSYREGVGGTRLEVGNALLFATDRAALLSGAGPYLDHMAGALRRLNPGNRPYRVTLYQRDPTSKLAKARAAALTRYFSRALLVNPERIELDVLSIASRGDATACVLPADENRRMPLDD